MGARTDPDPSMDGKTGKVGCQYEMKEGAMSRIICPVCHGKGSVNDPKLYGQVIGYVGPNGETAPQVQCQNCYGQSWVGESDVQWGIPKL